MKTQTNLNMSQVDIFQQWAKGYINDNKEFIKKAGMTTEQLANAALQHYNLGAQAFNETDSILSDEQQEVFIATAKRYFSDEPVKATITDQSYQGRTILVYQDGGIKIFEQGLDWDSKAIVINIEPETMQEIITAIQAPV
jgi:hypothetical protein